MHENTIVISLKMVVTGPRVQNVSDLLHDPDLIALVLLLQALPLGGDLDEFLLHLRMIECSGYNCSGSFVN